MEWLVWLLMATGISAFVITTIVDMIVMGSYTLKIAASISISQFVIGKENRILLRHYDIPANGTEIYQKMPYKASDGCVPPKAIKKVFESYGFHVTYCAGNLNALKREVCKGNPVIVFIKSRKDKRWLHFVPVVGYDEDNLFLAESAVEHTNCNEKEYNRRISNSDFMALWNTAMLKMPLYAHTFYVVEKK